MHERMNSPSVCISQFCSTSPPPMFLLPFPNPHACARACLRVRTCAKSQGHCRCVAAYKDLVSAFTEPNGLVMWMVECADCSPAQSGLHAWIRHLTDFHALPTEWPSDRALRLTGAAASKPYTTITESKKRRRKDSVPRPLNSFMVSWTLPAKLLSAFVSASLTANLQILKQLAF